MSERDTFTLYRNGQPIGQPHADEVTATRTAADVIRRYGKFQSVCIVNNATSLIIGVVVDDADGIRVLMN